MNDMTTHRTALPYATETVWDGGVTSTGVAGEGQALTVGYEEGDWGARISVVADGREHPRLMLRPCVVGSIEEVERATLISATIAQKSVARRCRGEHLHVDLDVRLAISS